MLQSSVLGGSAFRSATRSITGVTASLERRALAWLVVRIPSRIGPDHLTGLAFLAMLAGGGAYAIAGTRPWALWAVNVALAVNWFGDSLDGSLARHRRIERPRYGFYVDHVVDAAGIAVLVLGMAMGGFLSPLGAAAFLAAYFLVSIEAYLAAYCAGRFRLAVLGWGPTELRLALVVANTAAFLMHPHPTVTVAGTMTAIFDPGAAVAVVVLVMIFGASAVRQARDLYRAGT
ncbi:MAG: CDP-alcohol phosphatidyltransferase family protein [Vicinamibacterales bacterium]